MSIHPINLHPSLAVDVHDLHVSFGSTAVLQNIFDPATGERHAGFKSRVAPALSPTNVGYFIDDNLLKAAAPRSFAAPLWTFAGDGQIALIVAPDDIRRGTGRLECSHQKR